MQETINVYGYKSLAFAVSFVRVVDIYSSVNNVYTMQLQTIDHRFVLGSQRSEIWLGAMQLVEQNSSWPEMTGTLMWTIGVDLVNIHPAFSFVRMWPFLYTISRQIAISTNVENGKNAERV